MQMPTLSELIEAGAHFGHKKEKSYPRAKKYTFAIRDGIFVINLEETITQLEKAIKFLNKAIDSGQIVLFVGTKRQAKDAVKQLAEKLGMPYITERWPGGMLTNFETIRKSLKTLSTLEEKINSTEIEAFTKKERKRIEERRDRLNNIFEGVKEMTKIPDVLFVVDTAKEDVPVLEGNKLELPIVGICDTNANPDLVTIPIPANDDSQKTIELLLTKIGEGLGQKSAPTDKSEEKVESKEK